MHQIIFPEDIEDYEWLIPAKGYVLNIIVLFKKNRYALEYYDPIRLLQDIKARLSNEDFFFEPNIVLIPTVNRENVVSCINKLVSSNQIELFCPEKPVDENG